MKKCWMIPILAFTAMIFLSSCNTEASSPTVENTPVFPLLYLEKGNGKAYTSSTMLLKSGKMEAHEDYMRGFSYAIPNRTMKEAEDLYHLPIEEWQVLDYANYADKEFYIFDNWRKGNTDYTIIVNGTPYVIPKISDDSSYCSWSYADDTFYLFEITDNQTANDILIYQINLQDGSQSSRRIKMEYHGEKPHFNGELYCEGNNLYYKEWLPTNEQDVLVKYDLDTNVAIRTSLEDSLINYFLLEDYILLVEYTDDNALVLEKVGYDFISKERKTVVHPQNYGIGLAMGREKMAMVDGILYGMMTTPERNTSFFGYDVNQNIWIYEDNIELEKDTWLMDYHMTYQSDENVLLRLKPHVANDIGN